MTRDYLPTVFGTGSVTGWSMLAVRSLFSKAAALAISVALATMFSGPVAVEAEERLPWESPSQVGSASGTYATRNDAYRPYDSYGGDAAYPQQRAYRDDAYRPDDAYRRGEAYRSYDNGDAYVPPPPGPGQAYQNDAPRYTPYPESRPAPYERDYGPPPPDYSAPPPDYDAYDRRTYSRNEILDAGHAFFGSISRGLASVVEYAFQQAGRPNGYILGEDAGGAFVAGVRYGEGTLYTKDAGLHKVYWQGPSIGYDFGGEGSKTMILVYNLRHPSEIYNRFGGVQGSAYLIGGVSIQFQKHGDVVLAPIRSGVGLRLGANVGYLKYTRTPTWNPF
mgnify:CR=1 FL=1